MIPPFTFTWQGDGFSPVGRARTECDKFFVVGRRYVLVEQQERSEASHRHEFAWLREAWSNLPEDMAGEYPTPEHLRKRALVQAGYYHEEAIHAGTKAAALRVAAYARSREEFAHVLVNGPIVLVRTPKSQSRRAMDPKTFQASKTAILEIIAGLVGVEPTALTQNAGMAA